MLEATTLSWPVPRSLACDSFRCMSAICAPPPSCSISLMVMLMGTTVSESAFGMETVYWFPLFARSEPLYASDMIWFAPSLVAEKLTLNVPSDCGRTSAVSPKYLAAMDSSVLLCFSHEAGT